MLKPALLEIKILKNPMLVFGLMMLFTLIIAIIIIAADKSGKHTESLDIVLFIFVISTLLIVFVIIDDTGMCLPSKDTIVLPNS
jgi:exosortase/archaeosortase